ESQQCAVDVSGTDLYLTPSNEYGKMQLECESCTGSTLTTSSSLPLGVQVQLVAVVNEDANTLSLYQNGLLVTSVTFAGSLSQITTCTDHPAPCDWNNWLGRSQHIEDPPFVGKILDFRVYSAALSAGPIKASFDGGPDADW
ncbi:MAG TPA: LamG-like jellyroll fold domain-containing protein, partial [Polyangiaceae bacterium]|nr:LamG-like jellyroll fold domain-containing protein [Polyangiaceae bacterium]